MATLQNIRSKGPLLVIVIGLALFAFIAGDAWKVMQPHQAHDVGEVNGDALSAQEYQNLVEEYTEVVKLMRGVTALNDEQTNQVRDEVWRSYVNNKLIEKEAKALGLTVSAESRRSSFVETNSFPESANRKLRQGYVEQVPRGICQDERITNAGTVC